jgi:septal ring factor EnvC (AmiA/AmiB activator)
MAALRSDSKVCGPARAGAAAAPGWRLRPSALRPWRAAALAVLLAACLFAPPRMACAGLWSADTVAAYGLEAELEELRATRERSLRREALRRDLRRTVRELSRASDVLRRRAGQARARIAAQADALRAQERALDRVVPRLLARLEAIEQRRGKAARALADLASLSRQELDPELEARMRAIGPALLAALRNRDAVSATLARQRDRLVERQHRLAARMPVLRAELAQLHERREEALGQRRRALRQLVGLDAELRRLTRASAALARPMLLVDAAHRARAAPDAARPAQDRAGQERARMPAMALEKAPGMVVSGTSLRGRAGPANGVALVSRPARAQATMLAAAAPAPAPWPIRLAPTLAVRQALPHTARVVAARDDRAGAAGRAGSAVAPFARVTMAMPVAGLSSRVAPARLPLPAPIRPSHAVAARLDGDGRALGVTIAAVPGQRVAAPQDGRIVFADAFKGYGLLLIIEHDREYHTLLWGFSRLRVALGDEVRGGAIVGVMDVIDGVPPRLGVELRRRGRPVDPLPWLAASSSKVRG